MADNEKILDLAKKLKALADRGVGGEKINAQALLNKLLAKHGMSIEELEFRELKWHVFNVESHQIIFFNHIVNSVLGINFQWQQYPDKKNEVLVMCTNMEAIEIEGKFGFYWGVYQKDLESFLSAFIITNRLYPRDPQVKDYAKISHEERDDLMKIFGFTLLATRAEYLTQLPVEFKSK